MKNKIKKLLLMLMFISSANFASANPWEGWLEKIKHNWYGCKEPNGAEDLIAEDSWLNVTIEEQINNKAVHGYLWVGALCMEQIEKLGEFFYNAANYSDNLDEKSEFYEFDSDRIKSKWSAYVVKWILTGTLPSVPEVEKLRNAIKVVFNRESVQTVSNLLRKYIYMQLIASITGVSDIASGPVDYKFSNVDMLNFGEILRKITRISEVIGLSSIGNQHSFVLNSAIGCGDYAFARIKKAIEDGKGISSWGTGFNRATGEHGSSSSFSASAFGCKVDSTGD
ncbi:MAG: hypothetical protein LBH49_00760 [Puniceicoccales bacterium]|jgi:hypothetical protein|nr:hypothetical protein [Puniceicoccales bacterium]